MGNFSLDPNARAADALAKHYVGVRQQQAVPLLDADWNLLEDLRRAEHESLGQWFIGSGVPAGDDGFSIFPAGLPNDFGIRHGLCLVSGKLTVNDADTRYATQPNFGNPDLVPPLLALTTPPANKGFIVYLDVWEREVDSQADPSLVDARIGVESAIRLKRDWAVRVARIPEDLALLDAPPAGHAFLQLARLNRQGGNANITATMIEDLRDTQLSVHRKIDLRDNTGVVLVDDKRFLQAMESTRDSVLDFIRYLFSQFSPIFTAMTGAELLALQSAEHIASTAESCAALTNSECVTNRGALALLLQLYRAQDRFKNVWHDVVLVLQLGNQPKKYASYTNFIALLDQRLNQAVVGAQKGLLASVQQGDLDSAVRMQEVIAGMFGTAAATVPRGSINVIHWSSPIGNLVIGQTVRFEFRVESFTTLAGTYTAQILQATWPSVVVDAVGTPIPNGRISLGNSGNTISVLVDVVVQAGTSNLQLRVTSDANPGEIDQTSSLLTLTENQPAPPGQNLVQIQTGTVINAVKNSVTGVVSIQKTQTGIINILIFNRTGEDTTFTLQFTEDNTHGSWVTAFSGGNTLPVPNNSSSTKQLKVTPGGDAVNDQIHITASANVASGPVTGLLTIAVVATA